MFHLMFVIVLLTACIDYYCINVRIVFSPGAYMIFNLIDFVVLQFFFIEFVKYDDLFSFFYESVAGEEHHHQVLDLWLLLST